MLELMRKHAQSWLIKVALGGIIITFVLWYGWPSTNEKSRDYVAKVNDSKISYDQFRTVYDTELEKIRMRFKGNVPPELIEKLDLKKGVLQGLVHRALLLQEAEKLGLKVTDQDVIDDLKYNPAFQRDGQFDESIYRAYVNSLRLSPTAFEAARKHELLERQVVDLLTDSIKLNPDEIKKYWHFQNDKLALSTLTIPPVQPAEGTGIDQKALEIFYKENQAKYEIPQTLDIDYVAFSWRDLQKEIKIGDDEIKAYYTNNPKEFTTPEKIKIRHIYLAFPENADDAQKAEIRKKMEDLRQKILAGADFAELAKTESQDQGTAENGGEIGLITKGSLNPSIEGAAFKLDVGGISDPILLDSGFDLIKVEEKQPESQVPFEEAKSKIAEKLFEEKAKKQITKMADDFYEKVYRSDDLTGTASNFGFEVKKAAVTKAGGIPGIGSDSKVTTEIFSLKTGDVSKMLRSGDYYIVVKLIDRKKERIPPLDTIRSAVVADHRKELAAKETQEKATKIIEELKQPGADPDAIASNHGLSWKQLDPVTRLTNYVPKIGSGTAVQEMLATISMGAPIYPTPINTTDGSVIVRLTKIDKGTDEQFAKDSAAIEKWVLDVRKAEFLKGWLKTMEDKAKIDINDKNI